MHFVFDIISYIVAGIVSIFFFKGHKVVPDDSKWDYYTYLIMGVVIGSISIGTLNTYLSLDHLVPGKSIMGAMFGGIIAVESYKWMHGIKGSTGAYFVPSLSIGIAIGRIGCFLAGMDDYTYGIETTLPLGVDFGDGIRRHPVQLYESLAMFLFFFYAVYLYRRDIDHFKRQVFYEFVLFYAAQRFVWELFKPYAKVAFGLDIFGIIAILMIAYALYQIKRS